MNRVATERTREIPMACTLTGSEQAERQASLAGMWRQVQQVQELEDGYAFQFPASERWAGKLLDFILAERECCPFFTFELCFDAGGGPLRLRLRGASGVKAFIRDQFMGQHPLQPEHFGTCSCCT